MDKTIKIKLHPMNTKRRRENKIAIDVVKQNKTKLKRTSKDI